MNHMEVQKRLWLKDGRPGESFDRFMERERKEAAMALEMVKCGGREKWLVEKTKCRHGVAQGAARAGEGEGCALCYMDRVAREAAWEEQQKKQRRANEKYLDDMRRGRLPHQKRQSRRAAAKDVKTERLGASGTICWLVIAAVCAWFALRNWTATPAERRGMDILEAGAARAWQGP
jgi:hypothetical protein